MKFGKEFASQTIPEWQEAYMNYNYLKSLLKDVQRHRDRTNPTAPTPKGLKRKITFYRAFSGLTQKLGSFNKTSPHGIDLEDQIILVKHDANSSEAGGESYRTKFLMSNDNGGEYELVYFRRLDDEFNKVNTFYKGKVEEVMKEASLLNKQMDALIAFRIRVEDPEGSVDWSVEMTRLRSDIASSSSAAIEIASSPPSAAASPTTVPKSYSVAHREAMVHMAAIEELDVSNEGNAEELDEDNSVKDAKPVNPQRVHQEKPNKIKATRPAPLEVLNRVKYNNTLETPRSTLKGILKVKNGHELNFRKADLSRVEEKLKRAFIEFYQKLRLLKSYSFLNLLAFSKIMKKYDKITSTSASRSYLKMIDNSYLGSSEEVNKLMDRVEATFIKHFANANRSKGINVLRPKPKRERHRTTYSLGFFSGCTVSLVVALILIVRARHIIETEGSTQYMETMFPLYSLFGFVVLHILMYGGNVYLWRRYRVNYSFIFGFKQGTELGYRQVFLIATGLATLALACVLSNLDMEMDSTTKSYEAFTESLPLALVILVLVITFCPFNIVYRSSRFFLLRCVWHCIAAPLYKVTLPDFFMGDQFTSQVQALRSFEFYICYYCWGDFKHRQNTCNSHDVYNTFNFIIATLPYWARFMQCLRRLYEEKDPMQGYNGLKYLSTILAVCLRTAYSKNTNSVAWRVVALLASLVAAVVSTYWDLVHDWGLLNRKSKNPWLRDKLLVSRHSVYYVAMVLNVVLRFAWLQTVANFQVSFLHKQALIAIVASFEVIRRGIWNFFRLENEHLNNVGKYRAFKSVPLPFNYHDDQDDE